MQRKFKLGQTLATISVLDLCRTGVDLGPLFDRHRSGDWGDVDEEQAARNEDGLINAGPIKSVYHPLGRRVWIVTAGDRSQTVVSLPHEDE